MLLLLGRLLAHVKQDYADYCLSCFPVLVNRCHAVERSRLLNSVIDYVSWIFSFGEHPPYIISVLPKILFTAGNSFKPVRL